MSCAIRDNTALSRFELDADGLTAFMNYRLAGNVMSLDHTETPAAARGRGLASRLVEGALQIVRSRGLKVVSRDAPARLYRRSFAPMAAKRTCCLPRWKRWRCGEYRKRRRAHGRN